MYRYHTGVHTIRVPSLVDPVHSQITSIIITGITGTYVYLPVIQVYTRGTILITIGIDENSW